MCSASPCAQGRVVSGCEWGRELLGTQRHLCPLRGPSSDKGDPSCLQTKQPTIKPLIPTQRSQCCDWTIARHVGRSTEGQHLLKGGEGPRRKCPPRCALRMLWRRTGQPRAGAMGAQQRAWRPAWPIARPSERVLGVGVGGWRGDQALRRAAALYKGWGVWTTGYGRPWKAFARGMKLPGLCF